MADPGLEPIVPRWEWRAFGDSFGEAEALLAALAPTRVEDSDELYVLTTGAEASVKVRGGRLDVKRLLEVSEDGLQQWLPIVKAELPIDAAGVGALLAALGAAPPALGRERYGLDELVDEVVARDPRLRAVPVSKHRAHYVVDGCMAELTDVRAASRATRTIAVESEDPTVVRSTVEALGLWPEPNVSFPRGLGRLVGLGAHRGAIVDVGTNSVKLLVAERSADGPWHAVVDRAEVTRLGRGLAGAGRLDPAAVVQTADAIAGMVREARSHGVEDVAVVGTAWMRAAENADELVASVLGRSGVRIELVDGEEEARLSYLAAVSDLDAAEGPRLVFETGGGSTQFTFGRGDCIDERFSVPVGAAGFTERFGLEGVVADESLSAALEAIAEGLESLDGRPAPDTVVAMGGALTNLAAVKLGLRAYDPDAVRGTTLTGEELDGLIELFRTRSADERRAVVGLQPKRAEVILAGACIVRTVLAKVGSASLVVSDRGLRHRLLVERFGS